MNITNGELLDKVRELNKELEKMPVHGHAFALRVLNELGNHRATNEQREAEDRAKQARVEQAFAASPGIHVV